jgi:hypothetical protein
MSLARERMSWGAGALYPYGRRSNAVFLHSKTRQRNDRTITVHVLGAREFLFEGQRFKSLSSIARQVTGQHLSGPLFFGLKEVAHG